MSGIIVGDPSTVLRKARDLLNPKTWTQGALARDSDGRLVSPTSAEAVRWSAEGAIRRFSNNSIGTAILAIIAVEITIENNYPELSKIRLDEWNDFPERTVFDVKEMLLASYRRLSSRDTYLRGKKIFKY